MRTFSAHKKDVHGLAFSPDGRFLASVGGQSAAIWVHDARTGELMRKLPGVRDRARAVACGPDGLIAAADTLNRVRAWHLPKAELVAEITLDRYATAYDLAFLPDGTGLVTASQEVRVWNLNGDRAYVEAPTHPRNFHAVALAPDAARVAIGCNAKVSCWWLADGEVRVVDYLGTRVHAVTFDPTGRELAAAFGYGARVYDLNAGQVRLNLTGHQGMVWKVAYTPDGGRLVTASSDGTVRFWDTATGACRGVFDWQLGRVRCVVVSPDGLTVACGGQDGRIVIADVEA